MLDKSLFPFEPVHLPLLLSALAGPIPSDPQIQNPYNVKSSAAAESYACLSNLQSLTHYLNPAWYRFAGKDSQGQMLVEAVKDLILPGGASVHQGTKGTLLNGDEHASHLVTWHVEATGWALMVEILRVAAGTRTSDELAFSAPTTADFVHLSVGDLGIDCGSAEILCAGLKLLRSVLQPSSGVAADVIATISPDSQSSQLVLLQFVLAVLEDACRADGRVSKPEIATLAIDVMQALITMPHIGPALRTVNFFGTPDRRQGTASALIQIDSAKGEYGSTAALLRLVSSLAGAPKADEALVKAALHLVFTDVWSQFLGWRYHDVATKFDIASLVMSVFDTILRHPLCPDGTGMNGPAQYLIETYVHSASALTYRPLVEVMTQAGPLVTKLLAAHRHLDAQLVAASLNQSIGFMATLLRIATMLSTSATALPKSLLAMPKSDRVQLVDCLFDLAILPSSGDITKLGTIQLLRTWLEAMNGDAERPSLAGLLSNAEISCNSLGPLAGSESSDIRSAVWSLLGTIISTQPGCAGFCTGQGNGGMLSIAAEQITGYDTSQDSPNALAAVLAYVHSILRSPGSSKAVSELRTNREFWQAVYEIATHFVPAPPTFALSMHSEDFAGRIQLYAYSVQAKANATALLATELECMIDSEEQMETQAQSSLLSLLSRASVLAEATLMAVHNSCSPELHEAEAKKLADCGASLPALKTMCLPSERPYGRTYLYGE